MKLLAPILSTIITMRSCGLCKFKRFPCSFFCEEDDEEKGNVSEVTMSQMTEPWLDSQDDDEV